MMSLFTFNSDIKVEEVATSTRLGLISLMITAVAIITGLVTIYAIKPRDQSNLLHRNKGDTEIVILGDSTESVGIDPSGISANCLNLSIGGSGYTTWEPVLISAIRNFPGIRTVVISGDPMSLLRDGLGPRKGDLSDLLRRGARISDIPGLSMKVRLESYIRHESILSGVLSEPRLSWAGIDKLLKRFGSPLPSKKSPYSFSPDDGNKKKLMYSRMFKAKAHVSENRRALERMLLLARDEQLRVILIRPPVTEDFFTANQEHWEEWAREIERITKDIIPGNCLTIIDFSNAPRFLREDFADPNHLSQHGRQKFTRMIGQPIKQFNEKDNCYKTGMWIEDDE